MASVFERHIIWLQRLEEVEKAGVISPVFLLLVGFDFTCCKRFCLHFQIDHRIDIRGVEGDVSEPCADRVDVNAGAKKMGRCRVATMYPET